MANQLLSLVVGGLTHAGTHGEEAERSGLRFVKPVGHTTVVFLGALATQHGECGAVIQYDVVASTIGFFELQETSQVNTVLTDCLVEPLLPFTQRFLCLWVDQQLLKGLALEAPEQQKHTPVDEGDEVRGGVD